jgi:hypothetical protein
MVRTPLVDLDVLQVRQCFGQFFSDVEPAV